VEVVPNDIFFNLAVKELRYCVKQDKFTVYPNHRFNHDVKKKNCQRSDPSARQLSHERIYVTNKKSTKSNVAAKR